MAAATNRKDPPEIKNGSSSQLTCTWKAFKRALFSPDETFNPFFWIFRLTMAAGHDVFRHCRLAVPVFALLLICTISLSYFKILRVTVVEARWCKEVGCWALKIHDAVVAYLFGMTLFYFFGCVVQSPGIVLTKTNKVRRLGWCVLNPTQERRRLQKYLQVDGATSAVQRQKSSCLDRNEHPQATWSFCKNCNQQRPPRSHHCSKCGVCVLQFDHHCVWLGTCIGYANYRSFIGLLFFVAVSCSYGVFILFAPFYEPLYAQIEELGWKWLYLDAASGFWYLPPVSEVFAALGSCHEHSDQCSKIAVDVLYPLVGGVGVIMMAFLGQHVKYMASAHTTLEYRVVLDCRLKWWKAKAAAVWHGMQVGDETKADSLKFHNPFDQKSCLQNLLQIVGRRWWLFFLPIPVQTPPPFWPDQKTG